MRIAHITDLHYRGALLGRPAIERRKGRNVLSLLETLTPRLQAVHPDILVCTGDLLDYPLDRLDDDATREQGLLDVAAVRDTLAQVGCPVIAIPGNHDHPTLTWQQLGDGPRCRDQGGLRYVVFDDREDADHVPHRLGAERERFERVLGDAESTPQVHIQHFLVWPERNEAYPHTYADGATLADRIVKSGVVRLVLSGHLHTGVEPERLGDTWFATAPAFCEAPHPVWIYDLNERLLTWQQIAID